MMTALEVTSYRQPIRKSAQRLRWFFRSFEEQVTRVSAETGITYDVDKRALAAVFADWLKHFNAQKPKAAEDKPAYVGFAAGVDAAGADREAAGAHGHQACRDRSLKAGPLLA
jgi:hypothetical protein